LGRERGFVSTDDEWLDEWLVVRFDRHGRVDDCRIVMD
jgi:hypothetical protein